MTDYIENYPRLLEMQQQYAPQQLEAQRAAQAQAYPELESLMSSLTQQAQTGMSEDAPDWYMNKASDYMKSLMGENVRSGVGADFYTTGMMEQQKQWNDYYRNLGSSLAGRQPVFQSPDLTSGFTPQSVMGSNASMYGTQANMFGQQSQNAFNQANQTSPWMNIAGTMAGGLAGGIGTGMGMGFMTGGKKPLIGGTD